ncbi:N-6 DNA methylase [Dactylosporangium fulvum]|uniref:SAM-dependent methyltransferase n=1 Tax=Dactylosporangium fulvum TaxID=53359 RepID=A0ABY5WAU8_9ACTN|nr:SAM-dependent methyltransferase [Dactylosporangium fulvum]UWP86667.1 SAM-dependent methyltransferase [Dactylosporangium fulvum]
MAGEQDTVIGGATITASGIARLANVGRAAVSNWRRRYADFPAPVGGTPSSPSFNARDVEEWLRRQGKLHQTGTEQWAWRHIESYQPAAQIGDALVIAGSYLLARATQPTPGNNLLTPKQLTTQLRTVDRRLATLVGGVLPDQWGPQLTAMLRTVDQLSREQDAETAFEYLHSQYVTSAQSMSGLASTPDPVAEVMLTIAGPGTHVLDFTCGTGSILRMAADQALHTETMTHCYAQEIKPQYALIALLRLWFVHQRAQQAGQPTAAPVLHVGDSLLADAFADLQADVVVANFPFGIHDWGHDRLAYDPRWVYGLPPRTEPELAWVQHALAHLSPGGTSVVLMPPAAAVRPAGRRIRAELVRRGALRAVVALPAGLMPPAGIGLQIWVLTQPDEHQPPTDRLLFVNAAVSNGSLTDLIGTVWRDYRSGRHADVPGVHRTVPAIEVLDDLVDLTPQRYLPPPDEHVTDPIQIKANIRDLDQLLAELRHGLPEVRPAKATTLGTAPQASLADLIRAGSMSVLRTPIRTQPADAATRGTEASRISPGDLLIPAMGREINARVATPDQVGAEPEPDVQVLRIDPARFDPWFVAGVLSRTDNRRVTGRASSATNSALRIDLRRLTIPVLALRDQQEYGRAFRQLAEFRAGLEHAATAGATLAREINDGLISGTFALRTDRNASSRTNPSRTRSDES